MAIDFSKLLKKGKGAAPTMTVPPGPAMPPDGGDVPPPGGGMQALLAGGGGLPGTGPALPPRKAKPAKRAKR